MKKVLNEPEKDSTMGRVLAEIIEASTRSSACWCCARPQRPGSWAFALPETVVRINGVNICDECVLGQHDKLESDTTNFWVALVCNACKAARMYSGSRRMVEKIIDNKSIACKKCKRVGDFTRHVARSGMVSTIPITVASSEPEDDKPEPLPHPKWRKPPEPPATEKKEVVQ